MRTLSPSTAAKLFATGATVGPIVDSLHNQCLLRYQVLPICLEWPPAFLQKQTEMVGFAAIASDASGAISDQYPFFFCSSWTVPPLLGFAYVVLGGVLPRIAETFAELLSNQNPNQRPPLLETTAKASIPYSSSRELRTRAILAVTSTALIIKLSEVLETHPGIFDNLNVAHGHPEAASLCVMIAAAVLQWVLLDGSITALLVATVTAVGGPISELPFVGHGVWTYLEGAADYLPLQNFLVDSVATTASDDSSLLLQLLRVVFGTSSYRELALSSITGPCYFAVAMDAIALGRWFDTQSVAPASLPAPFENDTR
ncbi:unnamed protein product [Pseudo-nitzschia multistriata]|uniref:Uncharacterized protein n=1 Tax=Pseudo-nitzschia multistriata TaxID=183589 RepID=A0A448ZGB0_9STRA|nr:unnamed protein product [Pseudo-nitzschia multistriata]